MSKLYLAYGANTDHAAMSHRCPTATYLGRATVDDYRLVFRGVADIVPARGHKVVCALWRIEPVDEDSLDHFEGVASGFYRKEYADLAYRGKIVPALYYAMNARRNDKAPPPHSYEATLRRGYKDCGMPQAQINDAIKDAHSHSGPASRYAGKWKVKDEDAEMRERARHAGAPEGLYRLHSLWWMVD